MFYIFLLSTRYDITIHMFLSFSTAEINVCLVTTPVNALKMHHKTESLSFLRRVIHFHRFVHLQKWKDWIGVLKSVLS